jgi:hypothetical protein
MGPRSAGHVLLYDMIKRWSQHKIKQNEGCFHNSQEIDHCSNLQYKSSIISQMMKY